MTYTAKYCYRSKCTIISCRPS